MDYCLRRRDFGGRTFGEMYYFLFVALGARGCMILRETCKSGKDCAAANTLNACTICMSRPTRVDVTLRFSSR